MDEVDKGELSTIIGEDVARMSINPSTGNGGKYSRRSSIRFSAYKGKDVRVWTKNNTCREIFAGENLKFFPDFGEGDACPRTLYIEKAS